MDKESSFLFDLLESLQKCRASVRVNTSVAAIMGQRTHVNIIKYHNCAINTAFMNVLDFCRDYLALFRLNYITHVFSNVFILDHMMLSIQSAVYYAIKQSLI